MEILGKRCAAELIRISVGYYGTGYYLSDRGNGHHLGVIAVKVIAEQAISRHTMPIVGITVIAEKTISKHTMTIVGINVFFILLPFSLLLSL